MTQSTIGVIFDFDETLGPDTISYVLQEQGIDVARFWKEVDAMVHNDWDPPQAYMHVMLRMCREDRLDLSKKTLQKLGKKLKCFPGLPVAFSELKTFVSENATIRTSGASIEFYIISGGIEEVIRSTKLSSYMNGVFACNFAYEGKGNQPTGTQSTISFTEKTRFLHGIRKGVDVQLLRRDPYRINDAIASNTQRIPFEHMIYIGDGPSDIPCLSAVTHSGGFGIGASAPFGTFRKGYELARGHRISVGPYTANYKKGSDMRKVLEETILRIALTIDLRRREHIVAAPGH